MSRNQIQIRRVDSEVSTAVVRKQPEQDLWGDSCPGIGELILDENNYIFIYTDHTGVFLVDADADTLHTLCRKQAEEWIERITDNTTNELLGTERVSIRIDNE